MVHFWASEVTETKAAVVKVPEGFVLNVCNATLASDAASVVSLGLETTQMDRKTWKGVVAHLGAAAHAHQVKLDLVFGATPQVKFYVAKGAGKVNLTGYFQPGPPADLFDAAPAASTTTASGTKQTQQSSKKRARDEPVTWDQDASTSDSDDNDAEPKTQTKTTTPAKPAPQQQQKQKKPQQPSPAANGSSNATSDSASASKKKHRKKNKKPSA